MTVGMVVQQALAEPKDACRAHVLPQAGLDVTPAPPARRAGSSAGRRVLRAAAVTRQSLSVPVPRPGPPARRPAHHPFAPVGAPATYVRPVASFVPSPAPIPASGPSRLAKFMT